MSRRCDRPMWTAAMLALVVAACACVERACAQWTWESMTQPTMSQADFDESVKALRFTTADGEATFRALYHDMHAGFARLAAEQRTRMEAVRIAREKWVSEHPGVDPWQSEGLNFGHTELTLYVMEERQRLERGFEADVAAMLEQSQQEAWTEVTRSLHRRHKIPDVRRWGKREGYDPIAIIAGLELINAERAAVDSVLADYKPRMDEALMHWMREEPQLDYIRMSNAMSWADMEKPEAQERRQRSIDAGNQNIALVDVVVRVNRDAANQIAEALEPDNRARFLEAINRIVYPELFGDDPVDLAIGFIHAANDIEPSKLAAADAVVEGYRPSRDALRLRIVDVFVRTDETSDFGRAMRDLWSRYERGEIPHALWLDEVHAVETTHPAIPLMRARHKLGRDACRELRAVFDDAQFRNLPLSARLALGWAE